MAYRVTGTEVKTIFETEMTSSDLEPFIKSANALINSQSDMLELSDALLKEIEEWLSAHFASSKDQRISYQDFGLSKVKFQGEYKTSLNSTSYGQTAVSLDTSGTLQDIASGVKKARITAYPVIYPSTYGSEEDYRG